MPETDPPQTERLLHAFGQPRLPRFVYDVGTEYWLRGVRDRRYAFARGRLEVLGGVPLLVSQTLTLNTHSQIKHIVPGVLVDLTDEERAALDAMKGGYVRTAIRVFDVSDQRFRYAFAYIKPHQKLRRR